MQRKPAIRIEGRLVAGLDEAGRGPLAGPVVAAAVILAPDQSTRRLRDSKQLDVASRERIAAEIRAESLAWSVAWADRAEIDTLNVLWATMLAMRRAVLGLSVLPTDVRVDGNRLPDFLSLRQPVNGLAVIGGDATVPAISAASILAKTARDSMMRDIDRLYPQYAFAQHKGYCTALHRRRLEKHGPCTVHRRSFAPVKAVL